MFFDLSTTHKRIRPTNNDNNSGSSSETVPVPIRHATKGKLLPKKNQTVHGYLLPQLEEFDQWPGRIQWTQFLHFDDPNGVFRKKLAGEEYLEAWKFASSKTKEFLEEKLLPFVDDLKDREDGKSIMVAVAGLQATLLAISSSVSAVFLQQASDLPTRKKTRSLDELMEDAVEEIEIADFFGAAPMRDRFNDTLGSLRSINFETSSLESSWKKSRLEFVQGGVPSKRRRTTTPDEEDLIGSGAMSELSISSTPDKIPKKNSATPESAAKTSSGLLQTADFVDIGDLEDLPGPKFRESLASFSVDNVFRFLAKSVQERWEVFPIIAQPFVHSVAKMYETLIDLEKEEDGDEVQVGFRKALNVFNKTVFVLGLCETVIAPALQILCRREMKKESAVFLRDGLSVNFGEGQQSGRLSTLSGFVYKVCVMVEEESGQPASGDSTVDQLLLDYAKKEYIEGVVEGFFDLLLQWPRSRQNFIELKELMDETSKDVIHAVIISLQRQFHSRLLRPGLNTQDILAVYTAAIRALRIIDPSRVIQDLVCQPVRMYLRSRPDTVRCIMSHITHISPVRDTGDSRRRTSLPALDAMIEEEEAAIALTMLNPKNSTSDIDLENWKAWQPDPVYVELLPSGKRTDRQADTIELLMSIYGGQDVFINEYQLILAEKLLGYYPFDPDEEAKHLKMMTKRFGESLLQKSEVMSRDAADSQKFHDRILTRMDLNPSAHKCIPLGLPVKTLVISHHYWPEIRTEKIKAPEILGQAIAEYQQHFEQTSERRTIDIRAELGRVQFDLHLDDGRTMHLKCNPVYVAIILHFAQDVRWPLEDLAEAVGVSAVLLKKKLAYWQRRNVLEESEPDVFSVVAEGTFLSQEDLRRMEDEEIESAVRYVAENNQEEQNMQIQLQMFWKYMTTMLSTVQTITIDRLFAMVRMFIIRGQAKREVTIEHLRHLLDAKVRTRELIYANNRYSLPKKEAKEIPKDL